MRVCYDFNTSPPTYEFVSFLLWCESERVKRNEKDVGIVFSPGPKDGFRNDGLWPHKSEQRLELLHNLIVPMSCLLPNCSLVGGVANGLPGFNQRQYGFDIYVRCMAEIGRPLRASAERDSTLVTITLRECEHWPERNSKKVEWIKAATEIAKTHHVVFVNDTNNSDAECGEFETDLLAPINMRARAELYASAFCNMFISNGPAYLSFAMDAPTVMLRPASENMGSVFCRKWFERCGVKDQLPNCPKHQRIVWKDDTAENIIDAFEEYVRSSADC